MYITKGQINYHRFWAEKYMPEENGMETLKWQKKIHLANIYIIKAKKNVSTK